MKFSEETKQAFFEAFLTYYRNAGESFTNAYNLARADFTAAHRIAPNMQTFRRWYDARNKQGQPAPAKEEPQATETIEATKATETAETEPEAEEVPDEVLAQDEEAIQPADDYTKRLEMICRMYRTHSKESRDAICDYLLPELWRDEE